MGRINKKRPKINRKIPIGHSRSSQHGNHIGQRTKAVLLQRSAALEQLRRVEAKLKKIPASAELLERKRELGQRIAELESML